MTQAAFNNWVKSHDYLAIIGLMVNCASVPTYNWAQKQFNNSLPLYTPQSLGLAAIRNNITARMRTMFTQSGRPNDLLIAMLQSIPVSSINLELADGYTRVN